MRKMAALVPTEARALRHQVLQLAAYARPLLRNGENLQGWCRRHCDRQEVEVLAEAGMFHKFTASRVYKDNNFEYMHIHLPKSFVHRRLVVNPQTGNRQLLSEQEWRILLGDQEALVPGSGWEHYQWHHPEPHILLLRRPRPATQPAPLMPATKPSHPRQRGHQHSKDVPPRMHLCQHRWFIPKRRQPCSTHTWIARVCL